MPRPHHASHPYVNKTKHKVACVSETYPVIITRKIKSRERASLFRLSGSTWVSDGLHNSVVWVCAAVLAHSGGGRPRAQVYCLDANHTTGALIRLRTTPQPLAALPLNIFCQLFLLSWLPKEYPQNIASTTLVAKGWAGLHRDYSERVMT